MAFIRWKTNRTGGAQAYLVQSYRENGKPKQKTLAYLGDATALTPEHVAELKKRYPDQSIDWEAIKPRQKPLTGPQTLSDADLLKKMRHLRLERGLKAYHLAWKLREAGLKDFNQIRVTALEKEFAGVQTPERTPEATIVVALRTVFKLGEPPSKAVQEFVVPTNSSRVAGLSALQAPKPVTFSNFPPPRDTTPIENVEESFFRGLLEKNTVVLRELLIHDFVLVDAFKGMEIDKNSFLAVLESGQLKFETIDRVGSKIRLYKNIAIVVGETRMAGLFDGAPFTVKSRYTHVYVQLAGPWVMVSAQGTPIA